MRKLWVVGALAVTLFAAGCGNFWQAPGATTSTGTTATTTTLASSGGSTATEGSQVILTATVTPAAATGTVTFYNNSASIGTGTLSSGTATLNYTFTTTGAQSLTATYGGSSTYASSTSSAVAVTVSAATTSARTPVAALSEIHTTNYGSSPIDAAKAFSTQGGTFTAQNAQAVTVRSGGSVTMNGTAVESAAGSGRGILLTSGASESDAAAQISMTGGSILYRCGGAADTCEGSDAGGKPGAAVFAVADAKAAIALTDVAVTNETGTDANREGTLLTAQNGLSGAGVSADFVAKGTNLSGDVVADGGSTAAVQLLEDEAGTGSSLTGAINAGNTAKAVSLALDAASTWTVTGTSYVSSLSGVTVDGTTVRNIDGGGHCVYYSGTVNGASGVTYVLSGDGYLAPSGTTGLACQ